MKRQLSAIALISLQAASAAGQDMPASYARPDCDCSEYPFKPRDCYDICAVRLASGPAAEIDMVKGIDAGVSLSLHVLNRNRNAWTVSDLSGIANKKKLERTTLLLIRQTDALNQRPTPLDDRGNERVPETPI